MESLGDGPLLRWIGRRSTIATIAIVLTVIASVAVADWISMADIAFTLGYLLPIAHAAWRLPRLYSVPVAVLCAGSWLLVQQSRRAFAMDVPVLVANLVMELLVFLSFALLISALRDRLALERSLARTDSLTGMPNRRAFLAELEREVERCRRYGQPFSVAYLDVDRFKQVNDRLGHAAGDALLRRVARTMQTAVRKVDIVARLGGDEFAIVLPGADPLGAEVVTDRLVLLLSEWMQQEFGASCSIGCLTVLRDPPPVEDLVAHVDQLMYRQKQRAHGTCLREVWPSQRENVAPSA